MTGAGGDWRAWATERADAIRRAGRWRAPMAFDAAGPSGTLAADGRAVVSFASNDYLGLTTHPSVAAAAHEAIDRWGTGAGAARLVVGSRPVHHELEVELAAWKGQEAAVLLPTGYAANLAVLSTLAGPGVRICSDALNHASIVDGCRLARAGGADVAVYRHRDLDHLDALLSEWRGRGVVVSDTVFSMDGDVAPLDDLLARCARRRALAVLDEAHAVLGPEPPTHAGHPDVDVLRVGTLSKTLGSLGGFVAGSRRFVDLLVNQARPYIFTTASSPADTAAALAALHVLRSDEGATLVARLRAHVERVRAGHPSPIVPVVLGDEAAALGAAARLLDQGMLVPAIRPPTVAPGTCRLRVTLSAAHTDDQVGRLVAALADLAGAAGVPGARIPA